MRYLFFLAICLFSCQPDAEEKLLDIANWETIRTASKTQKVVMMMWTGDPLINAYMTDYVVPTLQTEHGIELEIISGQGNKIVSTLLNEKQAGKSSSEIDLVWINGETFYQLKQIRALFGPFSKSLPNSTLIDWSNPFIAKDFQQNINGMECPWGNVQMAWIYDTARFTNPPMDLDALQDWVKENPGKFTIGNNFTGMTLLKSWLVAIAGDKNAFDGTFDEDLYTEHSQALWAYINEIKPYLWNGGNSFPTSLAQIHQMFTNGEVWMTYSNNDSEVDNKIYQNVFPSTCKAFVPDYGSIQNAHYLAIPRISANKEAALVVSNFLISPAAQFEKMQPKVWGDGTVLDISKLEGKWKDSFGNIPGRTAPAKEVLSQKAIKEPAPEYMTRLFEDFRKYVIEN